MFTIGLIIGLVVGVIFNVVIVKWWQKAKKTTQELAHDIETEAKKASQKF